MNDEKIDIILDEKEHQEAIAASEEALLKYDQESSYRNKLGAKTSFLVTIILISFSIFQIVTSAFGLLPPQLLRSMHLAFVILLVYLLYPAKKNGRKDIIPLLDLIIAIIATLTILYIPIRYNYIMTRMGNFDTLTIIVGIIGVLVVLEACRRIVGVPILIIACCFIAYAFAGPYMPGFLNHRGVSVSRLVTQLFYNTEGIMGTPLGVSATFIFLFILFGSFLDKTGVGRMFIDIANAIAGRAIGGPAKVAVIASALQGTVSGSSVANTVGTGSFTIPMMKKLGYKPEFAGAVEAAASTGGQIMPPIMGAAAFLMAEAVGVPYGTIVKAAILPAIFYFSGILLAVHQEAKKLGLKGLSPENLPKMKDIIRKRGHLLIPLISIFVVLSMNYSAVRAALIAIVLSIACSSFKKDTRLNLNDLIEAMTGGARAILGVAVACAVAGIIVGVVTLTGLGLKMATGLSNLAGGHLILLLFFAMISSIILGMGVPTTANYLITSTICAPALIAMGVNTIAAHMFTFYFGIVADITPPVALAAFAASAIARSNPLKTGITATRIAIAAFLIPYMFVYNPEMLMINATILDIVIITISSLIGMFAVSSALSGFMLVKTKLYENVLLILGGLLCIHPVFVTDLIGYGIICIIFILQYRKKINLKAV